MAYRYLVFSGVGVWGKNPYTLTKEYFVAANQRGDLIVDLQENKYFDKDTNQWKDIEGDNEA